MTDAIDYAELPDHLRVAQVLLYTGPDGRHYMAPLGTPDPDPDLPLDPSWTEIRICQQRRRLP